MERSWPTSTIMGLHLNDIPVTIACATQYTDIAHLHMIKLENYFLKVLYHLPGEKRLWIWQEMRLQLPMKKTRMWAAVELSKHITTGTVIIMMFLT